MIRWSALAISFGLASCVQNGPPPPSGPEAFTVGNPYQSHNEWLYPRIFNSYDETGLSTVIGDDHAAATSDNAAYDPDALAASSPVLQLPAIVTVTNLVNGYSMDVKVNDRGPDDPGRILAVTPRVAKLLGYPDGGVVEVEVVLKPQETAALDGALGQGPKLTAAPVAGIESQSLGPPGSSAPAGAAQSVDPAPSSAPAAQSQQLSGQVTVYPPSPGPLYVQIPGFGRSSDADEAMQSLYGMPAVVVPIFGGDRTLYAVKVGPYHSVEDADSALQQVLSRGATDPEIIVR